MLQRYLANKQSGLSYRVSLLLVGVTLGGGLFSLTRNRPHGSRVTELTGLIRAKHHSGPMAFSPDGKTLALPKVVEGRVELWNLETGKGRVFASIFNKDKTPADRLVFSNDGTLLAVYYREGGITVWNVLAEKEQIHIPITLPYWVHD